jgi:hypothetical protein
MLTIADIEAISTRTEAIAIAKVLMDTTGAKIPLSGKGRTRDAIVNDCLLLLPLEGQHTVISCQLPVNSKEKLITDPCSLSTDFTFLHCLIFALIMTLGLAIVTLKLTYGAIKVVFPYMASALMYAKVKLGCAIATTTSWFVGEGDNDNVWTCLDAITYALITDVSKILGR